MKSENRIWCENLDQFCLVIARLQEAGLAFTARASGLFIDVTGY